MSFEWREDRTNERLQGHPPDSLFSWEEAQLSLFDTETLAVLEVNVHVDRVRSVSALAEAEAGLPF